MRVQATLPVKDAELLAMATTYCEGARKSKLFENPAAQALIATLDDATNRFKCGCEEARFHDTLKVAARNQIRKELIAALKRVIHYMEAMATDDDLLDLQKSGVKLAKEKGRKKKSKQEQAHVDLAPSEA